MSWTSDLFQVLQNFLKAKMSTVKHENLDKPTFLDKMMGNTFEGHYISTQPMNRSQVIQFTTEIEDKLEQRQARLTGYCPIRRQIYDELFMELIRQSAINCQERGLLLLRVKDELKMSMDALIHVYASALQYTDRPIVVKTVEKEAVDVDAIHRKYQQTLAEERHKSQATIKQLEDELLFLKKLNASKKE